MGSFLAWLLPHAPDVVKRRMVAELFRATEEAFQRDMPRLRGLSWEQCLVEYAWFTADWAEDALRRTSDLAELRARLYHNAYRLGRLQARMLALRGAGSMMIAGRFLYSVLDIDLKGSESGEITIDRCFFSSFYTPQVCELISCMDRGLFAGLSGGGELVFTQRITEGHSCCRAHFTPAANPSSDGLSQELTG